MITGMDGHNWRWCLFIWDCKLAMAFGVTCHRRPGSFFYQFFYSDYLICLSCLLYYKIVIPIGNRTPDFIQERVVNNLDDAHDHIDTAMTTTLKERKRFTQISFAIWLLFLILLSVGILLSSLS